MLVTKTKMHYLIYLIHLETIRSCRIVRRLITRKRKPEPIDADVLGWLYVLHYGTHDEITQFAKEHFT